MASDCDLRNRFLEKFPNLLDDYVLLKDGRIVKQEKSRRLDALKYLSDGLSFVSSRIKL